MDDLTITNVRLMRVEPYGRGRGYWNLIRIDTDAGIWGFGEAYFGPGLGPVISELLAPRLIGENPLEVLRADLALELEAIPLLREAIAHCESVNDFGSRKLFSDILVSEEEHVDWIETQLSLIERIGEPNYLAQQLDKG